MKTQDGVEICHLTLFNLSARQGKIRVHAPTAIVLGKEPPVPNG